MAITNALIANLAVGTAQIQDASVTDAKITALTISKLSGYGNNCCKWARGFVGSYTVRGQRHHRRGIDINRRRYSD